MGEINSEVSGTVEKSKVYDLDLALIRVRADSSFHLLSKENPFGVNLPWASFAVQLANSKAECAETLKKVLDNSKVFADIDGFYTPPFSIEEFLQENIENLAKIGVPMDENSMVEKLNSDSFFTEILEKNPRINEEIRGRKIDILEILESLHEEYGEISLASRLLEITNRIVNSNFPQLPWPSKEIAVYYSRQPWDSAKLKRRQDKVLLILAEQASVNMEELRKPVANSNEYHRNTVVSVGHELGHEVFMEIVKNSVDIKDIVGSKEESDIRKSLNEGLAILYEKLITEELERNPPDDSLKGGYWDISATQERNSYLNSVKNRSEAVHYLHGHRLMRRLIWDLGIYNLPKSEQIMLICDYLKKVDFVETMKINQEDVSYNMILSKPLENLPMKEVKQ